MTFRFDPLARVIPVEAWIEGPFGLVSAHLALDTGATRTLVMPRLLEFAGYNPTQVTERTHVTTGSRVESVALLAVRRITVLGHAVENLPVVAHELPAESGLDGLLGLDFFRDCRLELNFRAGTILLEPPHD